MEDYKDIKKEVADIAVSLASIVSVSEHDHVNQMENKYIAAELLRIEEVINILRHKIKI